MSFRSREALPSLIQNPVHLPESDSYRLAMPRSETLLALARFEEENKALLDVTGLIMAVEARPRGLKQRGETGERVDSFLRGVYALFLAHLDPLRGAGMSERKIELQEPPGRTLQVLRNAKSGLATAFGHDGDPARVILYANTATSEDACVRVELFLSHQGCTLNGIWSVSSLLIGDPRRTLGKYFHLSSQQGARLGELNARIRRQLQRSLPHLDASAMESNSAIRPQSIP